MRTALLILGTLVLMVGGFAVYWAVQPASVGHAATQPAGGQRTAQVLEDSDSDNKMRVGKGVWLKEFDKAGRMTNKFRGDEFNPQKEGFVRVKKPEAYFYMKGGQRIRVIDETGDVVAAGASNAGADPFSSGGGSGGAPTRGRLQNVRIQLFETMEEDEKPTLDMEMNNAAFDNESFRIFTEGYVDASGKQIPADEVRITVRGKYEFDGRGLTIRWNDRDQRLDLLEIAHGGRLVVKDPGVLGEKSAKPQATTPAATPVQAASPSPASASPVALIPVEAKAAPTVKTAKSATPATTQSAATLYSIWFYDNVQVVQSDKTLATGNVMEIFYSMKNTTAATSTAPATTEKVEAPAQAQTPVADTKPKPDAAAAEVEKPVAQTKPAEAKPEPILLYWTGKLRIVPSVSPPPVPLEAGDSVVQMRGAPVILTRDNVQIRCPSFAFRTSDNGAMLNSSDAFPQVEIEQYASGERLGRPDLTLRSQQVNYEPEKNTATLSGKSLAIFPSDEANRTAVPAQASWNGEGVARFAGSGESTVIKSLTLSGDVDVQHPQVLLKSQRLNLAFDPPAAGPKVDANGKKRSGEPIVRLIEADDAVHCVLLDEEGTETEVFGKHLDIATAADPAGKLYPKLVNASGDVRAKQQGKELQAGELALQLAPAAMKAADPKAKAGDDDKSKQPALALVRMNAKTNVRATSEDGAVATSDTLVATPGPDGKPTIELVGAPASVKNVDGTILSSPTIKVLSSTEARTTGPGTLHAIANSADPAEPSREMDVNWTTSAVVNMKLKENQVQVSGDVHVAMPEEQLEGTQTNTADAQAILITLIDKPVEPVKPNATKKQPKASPKAGTLASADMDVMKGKEVSRILLSKAAKVNSTLTAPDGSLLRDMQIESALLSYNVLTRGLNVPRPGRMIVRDHRPADAKDKKDAASEEGLSSQRGVSAFQWAQEMNFDGTKQTARMLRDVVVVYKPDDPKEALTRLDANEVVATFEEKKSEAAAPVVKKPGSVQPPSVQLRSIRATGNVVVNRDGSILAAPLLTYDPISHLMRAVGTEQAYAEFTSKGSGNAQTAKEFHWNTQTWKMGAVGVTGRAAAPPPSK